METLVRRGDGLDYRRTLFFQRHFLSVLLTLNLLCSQTLFNFEFQIYACACVGQSVVPRPRGDVSQRGP